MVNTTVVPSISLERNRPAVNRGDNLHQGEAQAQSREGPPAGIVGEIRGEKVPLDIIGDSTAPVSYGDCHIVPSNPHRDVDFVPLPGVEKAV